MRQRSRLTISVALAAAAVFAVVGVVISLGVFSSNKEASANQPNAGLEFSMAVGACNSVGDPVTPPTCVVPDGSTFVLQVSLDNLAGLGNGSYDSVAVTVAYTGLGSKDNPDIVWPSCAFEAPATGPGFVNAGCAFGISAPSSTFTGVVFTASFNCTADGTLTLTHGAADTLVIDSKGKTSTEAGPDSLSIDCQAATATPTPTVTPTPTNTPDASPTPTPNPNPRMDIDVSGTTTCTLPTPTPAPDACAPLFAGDEDRAPFLLSVEVINAPEAPEAGYGGFQTRIELDSGLAYVPAGSCSAEVVWPQLSASTCTRSGTSVVLHSGRSAAATPFPLSGHEANIVQMQLHCTEPGAQSITLRGPGGPSDRTAFVNSTGGLVEIKDETSVHKIVIDCQEQTPEMSLNATGPGVLCDTAPTATPTPGKPHKCIVPFIEGASATQTPFNLSVDANVIPSNATPSLDGYGGFDSNVFFGGLTYVTPKPSCLSEVVWPDRLLCPQAPATVTTSKQHFPRTGLFPPFNDSHYAGELLRMSVKCPSLGQFRVVLNGLNNTTRFVNPQETTVPVAIITTAPLDLLAATPTMVPIVDALLINCAVVPTATPTGTPTSTATPTPTPCGGPCPTATFTASATPTATNTSAPTNTNTPVPPTNTPPPPTFTPTITSTPTPCCEFINSEIFGPGKVTTDTENNGATGTDQVETSVTITSITGGKITIDEAPIIEPDPSGYDLFGQQVNISAPNAIAAANPNTIIFTLDASIVPVGENHNSVRVFRNGLLVSNCGGAPGVASPNPCVAKRHTLAGSAAGDLQFTVLTTAVSAWNFGVPTGVEPGLLGDVNCNGQIDPVDAQLILQFVVALIPILPCPENADVNGSGSINATDALLILQVDAGIIDGFPAGSSAAALLWTAAARLRST